MSEDYKLQEPGDFFALEIPKGYTLTDAIIPISRISGQHSHQGCCEHQGYYRRLSALGLLAGILGTIALVQIVIATPMIWALVKFIFGW